MLGPDASKPKGRRVFIVALWAHDPTDHYPPQFVGAVSEGLHDAWREESERLRELAEHWFADCGDDHIDWRFEVVVHELTEPVVAVS